MLASLDPWWYAPVPSDDPAATRLGETAEYRLVEELQKIRPDQALWRLRISDDALNAWLATRLRTWLAGRGVQWPEDIGTPQAHITTGGITMGVATSALGDRVGTMTFTPHVHDKLVRFSASAGLGRLPVPIPLRFVSPVIPEALGSSDETEVLRTLVQGDPVVAEVPLIDDRTVTIHDITLEDGAVVLHASTAPDD